MNSPALCHSCFDWVLCVFNLWEPTLEKIISEVSIKELSDEDMTKSKGKDPLEGLGGPMTRARARKAKEALQQVLSILFEYKPKFQGEKSKVVSCIMAQMEED